jgi:hypothetical protein
MSLDWMQYANMFNTKQPGGSTDPLSSAGQGAMQGAASGAVLGPWGAVAGGVLGAVGSAINASDSASDKQVQDAKDENDAKMLYQKFLQNKRIADEERARNGMQNFLDIGNQATKQYKGVSAGRTAALQAAGVM